MSFWGKACAVAGVYPAVIAGVGKGIYDAATGKETFGDSANKTFEKVVESAEKFGDENAKALTNAALSLGASVAGAEYKKHQS